MLGRKKMARLIDADTLMKEFAEFVRESNNSDFVDVPTWNDAVSLLGSAPTVEAIPKEWILKWANKHCMYCYDYDYPTEKELSWYDINDMVKEWEEENEID